MHFHLFPFFRNDRDNRDRNYNRGSDKIERSQNRDQRDNRGPPPNRDDGENRPPRRKDDKDENIENRMPQFKGDVKPVSATIKPSTHPTH